MERGMVAEADIDRALRRLLHTKLKLGLFDSGNAWDGMGDEVVEQEKHVALAREAAQKSLVLLKNNGVLPLDKNIRKMYVTGPFASSNEVLFGNYNGLSRDTVTIIEGITGKVSGGTTMRYNMGQLAFRENVNSMDWSTGNAATSDATVVVLGISPNLEGEEGAAIASPDRGDRTDLRLPEFQLEFLKKVKGDHGKPVIVVLTGGSPIASPEVHELADAVLFAWYPGQQGGNAVADVLFGDASPSGRLPITFPMSADQLPPYEDYSMAGRTYKYMTEKPLYPFGYGLSFTTFDYRASMPAEPDLAGGEALELEVTVRNTGDRAGYEIAQIYHRVHGASFDIPLSTLVAFEPVMVGAGEEKTVRFSIPPERLMSFDPEGRKQLVKGKHTVYAGGVSPGVRGEELTGRKPAEIRFTVN
jgi:beta-glucosidase